MSGSLARLVLRAQGRLPVAEPLLPSRYAAGPQPGFSEEVGIEPAVPLSSSPRDPLMPVAPAGPLSAPRSEPPAPGRLVGAWAGTIAETSDPAPLAEARTTAPVAMPRPIFAERPAAEPLPRRVPTSQESPPATSLEPPRYPDTPSPATAPAMVIEPASHNPDRRPSPGVSPFLAREAALAAARSARTEMSRLEAPASAPDVHISIGRVEVHAAPARPAPVRAAPARQSGLSLSDYLARRR
jgi:hypothetical protein